MKVVIGIVLISLVILGLIAYMILMLNAREMIFCGDLKNENGTNAQITRVYTTDLNANETLSEIIVKMNESDTESVQKSDITEVLAQYQNIIYAPVFTISVTPPLTLSTVRCLMALTRTATRRLRITATPKCSSIRLSPTAG